MRTTALILLVLLALAACGGTTAGTSEEGRPDTESFAGGDTDVPQGAGDSSTTTAGVLEENPDVESPAASTGTVTIGDTTYHFTIDADGTCDPDFYGTFRAFMSHVDADGAPLTGRMTISVNAAADGIIGGELDGVLWSVAAADEGSSIDSVDIDGNRLTGAATFVSPDLGGEPVPGSFEVTCAGE